MCGISGIYALRKKLPSKQFCYSFTNALAHRGPDGEGHYFDENGLYLGHRRLSILDLDQRAKQPFSFARERYAITFNGEIFNFLELRRELQSKGYTFKTESDTEVICASYDFWGEECQYRFNGMWAFAIWDRKKEKLFISRDRFGIKPFHYIQTDDFFLFSSEIKAFFTLPFIQLTLDEQAITDTIVIPNRIEAESRTLFHEAKTLQAGWSGVITKTDGLQLKKWWDSSQHLSHIGTSYKENITIFQQLFIDACSLRMRSDVPTASAVSGGLDSSSVLCTLAKIKSETISCQRMAQDWRSAFFIRFPNSSQDEYIYAKKAIEHAKARGYYRDVKPDDIIEHIDRILWDIESIFDLPLGPWSLYQQMKKEHLKISIDGHGADELLGGYHHHTEYAMAEALFSNPRPAHIKKIYQTQLGLYPENFPERIPSFAFSMIKSSLRRSEKSFSLFQKLFHMLQNMKKRRADVKWLYRDPTKWVMEAPTGRKLSFFNRILYHDFHTRTLPTILKIYDRCSMAHGIEVRAPFLDYRLVSFLFSLPTDNKIGGGFTKRILRDAMVDILPESLRTRSTKIGFASPVIEWMQKGLKPFILDTVQSSSFKQSSIWDGNKICDFVEKAYANQDYLAVRKCWEYIQAHRYIQLVEQAKGPVKV
jgi:asparagine synthase (glutamine-hydrolysing)